MHEHLALQEVLLVVGHLLSEGLHRQQQRVVLLRVRLQPHLMWATKKMDKNEDVVSIHSEWPGAGQGQEESSP